MLRQQGCDALADQYAEAAEELTQQIALVGIGGLTGWRRAAVAPELRGHDIPTHGKGVGPAAERLPGGRPDGQAVIAGHGWYVRGTGDTQMPSGTWGYFYVEDGIGLRQSVGLAVEQGKKTKSAEIVGPGKTLPNYTVAPGHDLKMMNGSITVSKDTLLSEILKPNMGPVHLAICRKHCDPRR